jgi:hypothetical protein
MLCLGALPPLILWATGKGNKLGCFIAGFDLGAAFYFEMVIRARRETEHWIKRTFDLMEGKADRVKVLFKAMPYARKGNPEDN